MPRHDSAKSTQPPTSSTSSQTRSAVPSTSPFQTTPLPQNLTPTIIQRLQRTFGNRMVQGFLTHGKGASTPPIQRMGIIQRTIAGDELKELADALAWDIRRSGNFLPMHEEGLYGLVEEIKRMIDTGNAGWQSMAGKWRELTYAHYHAIVKDTLVAVGQYMGTGGDVVTFTPGGNETVQSKYVTGKNISESLTRAVQQLSGITDEVPVRGSKRVADIVLENDEYAESIMTVDGLLPDVKDALNSGSDLKPTIDLWTQVEEIRIRSRAKRITFKVEGKNLVPTEEKFGGAKQKQEMEQTEDTGLNYGDYPELLPHLAGKSIEIRLSEHLNQLGLVSTRGEAVKKEVDNRLAFKPAEDLPLIATVKEGAAPHKELIKKLQTLYAKPSKSPKSIDLRPLFQFIIEGPLAKLFRNVDFLKTLPLELTDTDDFKTFYDSTDKLLKMLLATNDKQIEINLGRLDLSQNYRGIKARRQEMPLVSVVPTVSMEGSSNTTISNSNTPSPETKGLLVEEAEDPLAKENEDRGLYFGERGEKLTDKRFDALENQVLGEYLAWHSPDITRTMPWDYNDVNIAFTKLQTLGKLPQTIAIQAICTILADRLGGEVCWLIAKGVFENARNYPMVLGQFKVSSERTSTCATLAYAGELYKMGPPQPGMILAFEYDEKTPGMVQYTRNHFDMDVGWVSGKYHLDVHTNVQVKYTNTPAGVWGNVKHSLETGQLSLPPAVEGGVRELTVYIRHGTLEALNEEWLRSGKESVGRLPIEILQGVILKIFAEDGSKTINAESLKS